MVLAFCKVRNFSPVESQSRKVLGFYDFRRGEGQTKVSLSLLTRQRGSMSTACFTTTLLSSPSFPFRPRPTEIGNAPFYRESLGLIKEPSRQTL